MAYAPWIGNLSVRGTPGNYGTVKLFVDEDAHGGVALPVSVEIAAPGLSPDDFEVELFTNLNRRDFVKPFEPLVQSGDPASSYWLPAPMQAQGRSFDNLVYSATIFANKCGAYRLTARYRRKGSDAWYWHNDFAPGPGQAAQRDCAIVVSPGKTLRLRTYEANALTVEAVQGGTYDQRSTLDDFLPDHDFDGFNPFQLDYVRDVLGFNVLWLMPVFPITTWRWDIPSWNWASNDNPGSPYSTRDYWSVNFWLADDGTADRAIALFVDLVNQASDKGLDVFMDAAFNHAGRDVIYGAGAVDLRLCAPADLNSPIRQVHPAWCTRGNEFVDGGAIAHYRERAQDGFACAVWAPADRLNEHVWDDANVDWYFGDYSALGPKAYIARDYHGADVQFHDPRGGAEDERDLYYTDLSTDAETLALWRYFAYILPFWLERTGRKLAGMRADFAQGLPNQLWELIVNTCRKTRWDFIFLAEVLDPDSVQYRINKVFDVLTSKDHHLYRESDVLTPHIVGSLENEVRVLGPDAVVMHNGTSHDESGNPDKWAMVARYAVAASSYGMPMVFMGQPLGLHDKLPFRGSWADMYQAWIAPDEERTPVADMYRRINTAREASPELVGGKRYFLNTSAGGVHDRIFAVARWTDAGDADSIVIAFVNLSVTSGMSANFVFPRDVRLAGEYVARNLVANDPNASVWPAPRTADDIYANGIFVLLALANEVQYLRLTRA